MWVVVGVVGFLGFLIFLGIAFYSLIRKNGKAKRNFMLSGAGLIIFLIGAVGNVEPNKEITSTTVAKKLEASEIERLKTYATKIRGGTFLKQVDVSDNSAIITLMGDYQDFKSLNSNSTISEKDFNDYWSTGDAINKTLMEEPVRILREFPSLNKVELIIPINGKVYSCEMDRKMAESYFKINLDDLNKDTSLDLWREKIVNPYFNKTEREKYVSEFVKVK
ncbi:hypothetical protein [Brevibacillus sp. 1238]|uniref:hypothetical protein n=1 Tax=Brevibacillus sp. 1238 TaxID=2940565 RepID=UPI00247410B9|nr:hypothetical protein [Brevibacillus sp. 1238]MDH6351931.1 hypothetical protein [Brevibacillus sp. 1238]